MRSSWRRSATCAIVFRSTRRGDRVALGLIGVQQGLRRGSVDHLGQLPPQVHRILHADVQALPAHRGVHVRGVAGKQHAPFAIGHGLTGHVGEAGDERGLCDAVVCPVDGDERLAEILQGGLAAGPQRGFGQDDATRRRPPGRS